MNTIVISDNRGRYEEVDVPDSIYLDLMKTLPPWIVPACSARERYIGYFCTRVRQHEGIHVAHGVLKDVHAVWINEEEE